MGLFNRSTRSYWALWVEVGREREPLERGSSVDREGGGVGPTETGRDRCEYSVRRRSTPTAGGGRIAAQKLCCRTPLRVGRG